jgi:hypothetical protein
MLIVYMHMIKLSHIQPECEYRKSMSLLYKLYYTNIIFTEKIIIDSHRVAAETPTPHAIYQGQCKPLKEIFIIVVHLISIF